MMRKPSPRIPTRASQLWLCFALPSKEEIREGVAAFARVCFEQTGIPAQSGNVRNAGG
jgi:2-aminoadipate transaminase